MRGHLSVSSLLCPLFQHPPLFLSYFVGVGECVYLPLLSSLLPFVMSFFSPISSFHSYSRSYLPGSFSFGLLFSSFYTSVFFLFLSPLLFLSFTSRSPSLSVSTSSFSSMSIPSSFPLVHSLYSFLSFSTYFSFYAHPLFFPISHPFFLYFLSFSTPI